MLNKKYLEKDELKIYENHFEDFSYFNSYEYLKDLIEYLKNKNNIFREIGSLSQLVFLNSEACGYVSEKDHVPFILLKIIHKFIEKFSHEEINEIYNIRILYWEILSFPIQDLMGSIDFEDRYFSDYISIFQLQARHEDWLDVDIFSKELERVYENFNFLEEK